MVVTFFPSARETGATQERTAWPSICTVQAPHSAMPQPYLVPAKVERIADYPQQKEWMEDLPR